MSLLPKRDNNEYVVPSIKQKEGNQQDSLQPTAELTDEQARLCPASIGCHSLSDMQLYAASVERLTPVAWDVGAMDHLVLDEKKKDILKGLVGQHYNSQDHDMRSDIIDGKGKSLIILLHGPPGVGKTLTAECVSEAVKRPLVSLSIGDLVWEDKRLQQRLQVEFNRARDWNAILLLDEADVVLEARSFEDVRRNGIVTVFLRQLEYFQGVLFLTSNRVSTMDVAFQSRIQIGISFREMTPATRAQIWERLLSLNGRDKMIGPSAVEDVKHRLGKFQLNGRQIRNVLNVADGLAFNEYGVPGKLKYRHIQEAVETAVEFQKMLDEQSQGEQMSNTA
ncbi:hypothetical protein ASPFODRAFT_84868 [Aspergillus luchuensis CBS 106.47]|uniref:AAA+ ATPase domain-containing protein n=1 Tax=Aspergillus luchuensis (strain CBS 106.47) TaxID=1137211 RepID=A0A1M3T5D6_ASPLC|nr:hypothetical protein ASPFODRAFT_84868 [Aspergillus luchuensis CBS 106.47]